MGRACGQPARGRRHRRGSRAQGAARLGLPRCDLQRRARLPDRGRGPLRLRPHLPAAHPHRPDAPVGGPRRDRRTAPAAPGRRRTAHRRTGTRAGGQRAGPGPDGRRAPARTRPAPAPLRRLPARPAAPAPRACRRGRGPDRRGTGRGRARPRHPAQGRTDPRTGSGAAGGAAALRRPRADRAAYPDRGGRRRSEALRRRTRRGLGAAARPRRRRYDRAGRVQRPGPEGRGDRTHGSPEHDRSHEQHRFYTAESTGSTAVNTGTTSTTGTTGTTGTDATEPADSTDTDTDDEGTADAFAATGRS